MSVMLLDHRQIEPYLAADPVGNLFPRFVFRQRPERSSLAFVENGAVHGAVVMTQVYSLAELRGEGHAKELIVRLLGHPEIDGTTVTWLASASNVASIGLAQRLGSIEYCAFGCLELVPD
jgi:hypothetical protein